MFSPHRPPHSQLTKVVDISNFVPIAVCCVDEPGPQQRAPSPWPHVNSAADADCCSPHIIAASPVEPPTNLREVFTVPIDGL